MTVPAPSAERRRERYRRRSVVRRVSASIAAAASERGVVDAWGAVPGTLNRCGKCGFVNIAELLETRVTHGDDGPNAYVTGLSTCSNVWLCPVCSAKIRTRRQLEVQSIATQHAARGGTVAMMTLTCRHDREHTLSELMEAQGEAWRSLTKDRRWVEDVRPFLAGTVRSWEVTQGFATRAGSWHPHFHVLLLWQDGYDLALRDRSMAWIANAWASRITARLGSRGTPNDHGFDYRRLDAHAAEYVAKIGAEMTRADTKGGAQIWQLIDAVEDGETWATRRLLEYVTAVKGKRAIQFSRGLREEFGLDVMTDEEIAELEVDGEFIEHVRPSDWRRMSKWSYRRPPRTVLYLEAVEQRARARGPTIPADAAPVSEANDIEPADPTPAETSP